MKDWCNRDIRTGKKGYVPISHEKTVYEAWWCCVHHGGLALVEYARHAVTLRDDAIHVNLLVPGRYRVALPGGREAEVHGVWRRLRRPEVSAPRSDLLPRGCVVRADFQSQKDGRLA